MNHIASAMHKMIDLQLERHGWISRAAAQIESYESPTCEGDEYCRCRRCKKPLVGDAYGTRPRASHRAASRLAHPASVAIAKGENQ